MNSKNCRKWGTIHTYIWLLLATIALLGSVVSESDRILLALGGNILLGQAVIQYRILKIEERFSSIDKAKSAHSDESYDNRHTEG